MSRSEPELYKDKIEVSLDGRQIFYLFFGGAVIACLVFVLGVLVGKRVEARSHVDHAGTTAARDPLAALDALDATSRGAVTPVPAGQMERAVADLEGAQRTARSAAATPAKATASADEDPAPAVAAAPAEAHGKSKDDADGKDKGKDRDKDKSKTKAKADGKADGKADSKADDDKDVAKTHHGDDAAPVARPAEDKGAAMVAKDADKVAAADKAAKDDVKKKGRYTLQLSSFQDKGEAQAFLDSVKGAGYSAYLVEADVDGKGTFYRVRLGTYSSYDDAIDAKSAFEAKVKKVAYVTKL